MEKDQKDHLFPLPPFHPDTDAEETRRSEAPPCHSRPAGSALTTPTAEDTPTTKDTPVPNTIFSPSAFPQPVLGTKSFAVSSKYFYLKMFSNRCLYSTGCCPRPEGAQPHFLLSQAAQAHWVPLPLTRSLSLTDTLRVESEAVAGVRDPLRPSSRFSLLASVSITATYPARQTGRS